MSNCNLVQNIRLTLWTRILDPDNEYLRPILFYAEGIENLTVEGILMKDSPVWHNFIVDCKSTFLSKIQPQTLILPQPNTSHTAMSSLRQNRTMPQSNRRMAIFSTLSTLSIFVLSAFGLTQTTIASRRRAIIQISMSIRCTVITLMGNHWGVLDSMRESMSL